MGTANNMHKLRNSRKYDSKIKHFQVTRPTRKAGRVEKGSTRVQPEATRNTKRLFFLDNGHRSAASKISIQFHMVSYCSAIKCHLLSKCYFWGSFEVDSSSALGQLWITRSPLCPLLSVLAWLQLLRGLGSPQRQKQNT